MDSSIYAAFFYCHGLSKIGGVMKKRKRVCMCIFILMSALLIIYVFYLYVTSNFLKNVFRCPCDECTITHMITCGIINPEQLETNGAPHTFHFPHDSNRYIIDVTPPSMSSTTSSSASTSPVPISREMAAHHLNSCNLSPR